MAEVPTWSTSGARELRARGSQNYSPPENLARAAVGSVVIWRTPIKMAFTAAALK